MFGGAHRPLAFADRVKKTQFGLENNGRVRKIDAKKAGAKAGFIRAGGLYSSRTHVCERPNIGTPT